ncbi:Ubiquitin fusion degradation protein 1-like [Hondaea fermentalgiana]|uniref:Ubiquitin fusion degradation protein 1-like n=1 Tax=Hondaea fermentalgiana TaxID=2315210 RepID=A0A2R5GNH9_9STRA|nr:Ubiquitin fusion degradation protein 1-like [Hondaea fermentalgiana]|eukprot:GBG32175.1 Ubiquitin fusion degradation protein 1-like [Hondaea fermentalgiana]
MMFNGMNFGNFGAPQGPFQETYRCLPISFSDKEDKENGDKIILPTSAFETLARMTITYPMQFELRNDEYCDISEGDETRIPRTHVGVLEFTAPEGRCYVPYWIMQNLFVQEGGYLTVKNVTLPLAQFIKFRPQSVDFLDISNPKAVLESTLRNFSCVTKEDTICLPYNGKKYYLDVVDVKPKDACSIVEADVKVDFEAPPGYQEPGAAAAQATAEAALAAAAAAAASGAGAEGVKAGDASAASEKEGAGSSTSVSSERSSDFLAQLARARELRMKELDAQKSSYVAFSGTGQRVDGKRKPAPQQENGDAKSGTSTSASGPVAQPLASARKGKWKSKNKGSSFQGQGRSLAD